MPRSDVDVAVIGGGAAGIAAARRLGEAGDQRAGGRGARATGRPRLDGRAGGYAIDLGCGWLHSADRNPWVKIAEAQGRDDRPARRRRGRARAARSGFPIAQQEKFCAALWALHDAPEALPESGPNAAMAALARAGRALERSDRRGQHLLQRRASSTSVSARDLGRYEDDGVNWRVVEGYGDDHRRAWRAVCRWRSIARCCGSTMAGSGCARNEAGRDRGRRGDRHSAERVIVADDESLRAGAAGKDATPRAGCRSASPTSCSCRWTAPKSSTATAARSAGPTRRATGAYQLPPVRPAA